MFIVILSNLKPVDESMKYLDRLDMAEKQK